MAYTTIDDPSVHFSVDLWTGGWDGSNSDTHTVVSGFQPDAVWIKKRSSSGNHQMFDSSRGITTKILYPHLSNAEATVSNRVQSVNSDGYVLGPEDSNSDGETYVGWSWKCNGGATETPVAESGDNPANVRQTNTDAGFSIITYTGTGDAGTIAHGLGAVPHFIIAKQRTSVGGVAEWVVYHKSIGETHYLKMSTTAAKIDSSGLWEDTAPTSSVFTVHSSHQINADGGTFVAYVFTEKQGYSKFGGYTGNGDADGTFVYTGFKPAWLMVKRTDSTSEWSIYDTARKTFNVGDLRLNAETNDAEDTHAVNYHDILSNGFKMRNTDAARNGSGNDYIYAAFAEQPFVTSGGVPCTAR